MQQLAASLGTTPANIRKIRQRALAKLKNLTETI
jgi:transcriptional regulator